MLKEDGVITLSGLIILMVLSMITYFLFDIYVKEDNSIKVLKLQMIARNFNIGRTQVIIDRYRQNLALWQLDTKNVQDKENFTKMVVVDEYVVNDAGVNITEKAYLRYYEEDIYILIVETTVKKIVNQVCVYLKEKDGDIIVQRWER